jgi:hypothetical protein
MTDKIRECVNDSVAIADCPHPWVFEFAQERVERLLREFDAEVGFPLDDRFHEPDHGTGDLLVDSSFAVR